MGVTARQSKVGINIATSGSWGTGTADATAVGAGDGHYVLDDLGIQLSRQQDEDNSAGQDFVGSVQQGNVNAINAAVPTLLHYNDTFQNVLWALALGTGGTSPSQVGATTAYTNTFEPATNKTGLYATIVRDKVQYISEVPGAKCTGFSLSYGDNGRALITWNFIGDTELDDSAINTSTQVSALTFPTQGLRAFFRQMVCRINTQGAGALGASDAVKVTDVKLTFEQPLDTIFVAGQTTIIEPEDNNYPNIMLELSFARFDTASDDFWSYHADDTALKGDITFTGPTLATTNYGLLFQFPHLKCLSFSAPIPGAAGQVAPKATLKAYKAAAAPTGMTGITKPVRVTTTGVSTVNPFA